MEALIDLKDEAVSALRAIQQIVTDAQLGRKTSLEALSAIGTIAGEVIDDSDSYDAQQELD
jgi:hypothetical protein